MKALKVIFISLVIIVVVVIAGVVIFLKTFNINRYKDQITSSVSQAIGRDVAIGNIALQVSLKNGVALQLRDVSLAELPEFKVVSLFSAQVVDLKVEVMPLLTQRKILVSSVIVNRPQIALVKNTEGEINVQKLAESIPQVKSPSEANKSAKPSASSPIDLTVKQISINDAKVSFDDLSSEPSRSVVIDQINLAVNDFSLSDFFTVKLTARAFSNEPNLLLSTKAKVDQQTSSVSLSDFSFQTSLKQLSYDLLLAAVPELKSAGVKPNWQGDLQVSIPQLSAGASGLGNVNGNLNFSNGHVEVASLPNPIENIKANIDFTSQKAVINDISCELAGGTIALKGEVLDLLATRSYDVTLDAQGIDVSQIATAYKLPVNIQGKIVSKGNFKGMAIDDKIAKSTLTGTMSVNMLDGKLVNLNAYRLILDQISIIPGLVERLNENLSDESRKRLEEKDTLLKEVSLVGNVREEMLNIQNVLINAEDFVVNVNGQVGFDLSSIIYSKFLFSKGISTDMAAAVEELAAFMNENGQLDIPLRDYQGPITAFKPMPNVERFAKEIIKQKAGEELGNALRKALGVKEEQEQQGVQKPSNTPKNQNQEQAQPEEAIIDGLLDSIFK